MYIKATQLFLDREEDLKRREPGDIWEVSETRGKKLIELGYAIEAKKPKKTKVKHDTGNECVGSTDSAYFLYPNYPVRGHPANDIFSVMVTLYYI